MAKKTANGGGSIRQRKNGLWEGRYSAGRDPGTGKQIQRSVYGKTQQEVRRKLNKITASIDDGLYIAPCDLTVSQWLNIWLKEYTGTVKPLTLKSYRGIVKNHLQPLLGAVKLLNLGTHQIQSVYNKLLKGETSPKTIKNINGVLNRALSQAVAIGYI